MKALAAVACLAALGVAGTAAAQSWSEDVRRDLQAMHDVLKAQHPAPAVGREAEAFNQWVDAGLAQINGRTNLVINPPSYAYALRAYANGFRDSNIRVQANWAQPEPWSAISWPQFSTAWRDGGYVVAYVAPGAKKAPPVGARLVSCDGKTAEEIAQSRLDKYEGDLTLEADRYTTAPYLLWDRDGSTIVPRTPLNCQFTVGKRKRDYLLSYTISPDANLLRAGYLAAAPIAQGGPTVEAWNGGFWIKVPTFVDQEGWPAFIAQLEAQRAAIQAAPTVVIDLRGANKGVVQYRLANYIWGPDFVRSKSPKVEQSAFRVTPELRAFFVDVLARQNADPQYYYEARRTEQLIADIDAAIAAGQTVMSRNVPIAPPTEVPANPMQGKVIVLTDGFCSGPCLDMMDLLTRLPNVTHVGSPTSASSIYVGEQVVQLPSGNGRVIFGNQAWLDRPRAGRTPYKPAKAFTGNWADEAAVRAFVAGS